jgi:hypothetical protein
MSVRLAQSHALLPGTIYSVPCLAPVIVFSDHKESAAMPCRKRGVKIIVSGFSGKLVRHPVGRVKPNANLRLRYCQPPPPLRTTNSMTTNARSYPSVLSQPGSASRNIQPILEALAGPRTPSSPSRYHADESSGGNNGKPSSSSTPSSKSRRILELASHPYDHIEAYAKRFPNWQWHGSARDQDQIE